VQLHFGLYSGHKAVNLAQLRELSDAVGGAIFVRRALAINRDAFASGLRAAGVPNPSVAGSDTRPSCDTTLSFPASESDEIALAELDDRAAADKALLSRCGCAT
jgi:hypothetical protein